MSTTIEDLNALLAVQAADTRIQQTRDALAALDAGAPIAAAYNKGKTDFDRLKTVAVKAETEQKDADLRLQSIDAKIVQVNKTLYGGTVTASRELENLQRELDMLERQRSDAEEKVFLAMEAVNQALTRAQEKEAHLLALAEKYKAVRAVYKQEHQRLSGELKAFEAERTRAAKAIPRELLEKYDAIRVRRNGLGVVMMLENGACGGCYTLLSKGLSSAIRTGSVEVCEFCGRYLALPATETK